MPYSLVKLEQEEVDETKLELTLLSDLTAPVPNDVAVDFDVLGVELGPDSTYKLAVLIDNEQLTTHTSARAELKGLENGYHLLRAFIVDQHGACVKSALGYVEAEFYVVEALPQKDRGYMFGQPSLCHVSPRGTVLKTLNGGVVVDAFVHNCMLSKSAAGFAINVYVSNTKVGTITDWAAYEIQGLTALDRQMKITTVLVNPAGEEVARPSFNQTVQHIEVKHNYA